MKKLIIIMLCLGLGVVSQAATLTLNLKCLIQGYYSEGGQMVAAAENQGCAWAVPGLTDRVQVLLRKAGYPHAIVGQAIVSLPTSGQATANITHPNLNSGSYYIVVKNSWNALETWSAAPVAFTVGHTTNYDFTDQAEKAYGNNMYKITDPGDGTEYYCFYSGDINKDGNIDLLDETQLENDILNFESGCVRTDLNGDGNTDILDQPIFETNAPPLFIHVKSPLISGKGTFNAPSQAISRPSNIPGEFEVFPTPSNGYFNVHFTTSSLNSAVKFQLMDASNKLILETESTCAGDCTERFDLPVSATPGLYFLRIIENGQSVAVKKVMVQK